MGHPAPSLTAFPLVERGYVVKGARIFAGDGWSRGDLICGDGVVVQGSACERPVEVDGTDLWITPFLTDAHTHLGICRHGVQRSIATFWELPHLADTPLEAYLAPRDPAFAIAAREGIGTLGCDPPSTAVVGGHGWLLQCSPDGGRLLARSDLKCALGDTVVRFAAARGVRRAREELWQELYDRLRSRNMPRGSVIRVHAHRWTDLHAAALVAQDLGLQVAALHASQVTTAIDRGAEFRSVLFGPLNLFPTSAEAALCDPATVARLLRWKVPVCLVSDAPVRHPVDLRRDARGLVRFGVSDEEALACVSVYPRTILGLPMGTRPGETSAFAAYTDWPLSPAAEVALFVEGRCGWAAGARFDVLRQSAGPLPLRFCRGRLAAGAWAPLSLAEELGLPTARTEIVEAAALLCETAQPPLPAQVSGGTRGPVTVRCVEAGRPAQAVETAVVREVRDADGVRAAVRRICGAVAPASRPRWIALQSDSGADHRGTAVFDLDGAHELSASLTVADGHAGAWHLQWHEGVGFSAEAESAPPGLAAALSTLPELAARLLAAAAAGPHGAPDRLWIEWAHAHGALELCDVRALAREQGPSRRSTRWPFVASHDLTRRRFSRPWREVRRWVATLAERAAREPGVAVDCRAVEWSCRDALARWALSQPAPELAHRLRAVGHAELLAGWLPLVSIAALSREGTDRACALVAEWAAVMRALPPAPSDGPAETAEGWLPGAAWDRTGRIYRVAEALAELVGLGRAGNAQRVEFSECGANRFRVSVTFRAFLPSALSASSPTLAEGLGFALVFDKDALAAPLPFLRRARYASCFATGMEQAVQAVQLRQRERALTEAHELDELERRLHDELRAVAAHRERVGAQALEWMHADALAGALGLDGLAPSGLASRPADWAMGLVAEAQERLLALGDHDL